MKMSFIESIESHQFSQRNKQMKQRVDINNKYLIDLQVILSSPANWTIKNGVSNIYVHKNSDSDFSQIHYLTDKEFKDSVTKILNELKIFDFCIKYSSNPCSSYYVIYLQKISTWNTIFHKFIFNCSNEFETSYYI